MADSHKADPVRDLNNFLQGQQGGNMTKQFKWDWSREGPEHDAVYHVTAVCEYSLCNGASSFLFSICTTVRGVNIGVGHGPSKRAGKRTASVQALEYLRSYGNAFNTIMIGQT